MIFPAILKLRYSHGDVHRPYTFPFGQIGVWIGTVVVTLFVVLGSWRNDSSHEGAGRWLRRCRLRVAPIAARRKCFERVVFGDIDLARAQAAAGRDDRFGAAQLDAGDANAVANLAREERVDAILNAADPRFNPSIFAAAFDAGCTYLDMAMTLSGEGKKLGDDQFAEEQR
jgi:hypothetical protein